MILPSDICPGHVILHLFAKTVNRKLRISLNNFSVRFLKIMILLVSKHISVEMMNLFIPTKEMVGNDQIQTIVC